MLIGGKVYQPKFFSQTKKGARQDANLARKLGYSTRTRPLEGGYQVYVRKAK